jgi:hypothetical protein
MGLAFEYNSPSKGSGIPGGRAEKSKTLSASANNSVHFLGGMTEVRFEIFPRRGIFQTDQMFMTEVGGFFFPSSKWFFLPVKEEKTFTNRSVT